MYTARLQRSDDHKPGDGQPASAADRGGVEALAARAPAIGFVFNHDAGHQAAHAAPVLAELARLHPQYRLIAFVSSDALRSRVENDLPGEALARVEFASLPLAPGLAGASKLLDPAIPASRVMRLYQNKDAFADLDVIVAPERTSLFLKNRFGVVKPKYVHIRHGAGDRAIGFHPSFRHFDLLLLQGQKYVRRLRESGGLDGNDYALIGYPKFDIVDLDAPRQKFFDNDNPVVFYNPHFTPGLSSWNRMGHGVLDYFARNPDLNLIFSPHVMLFKRKIHISPDSGKLSIRKSIKAGYSQYKNILVDLDSPRQFDMTYTLNSDLYLADVSSQVIEFLVRPRPCVFLNPNKVDWRGKPEFAAWGLGEVVDEAAQVPSAIRNALADPTRFGEAQQRHFEDSINLTDEPSATRAARAIADYLELHR